MTESATDYFIHSVTVITALRKAGGTLSYGLLIATILKGLPASFMLFEIHIMQDNENITHRLSWTEEGKALTF